MTDPQTTRAADVRAPPTVRGGRGWPAIDPACVEARGLALGLRRAWRLRLSSAALKSWRRGWRSRGLHLTSSRARFAARQGGVLRRIGEGLGDEGVHLVVLAPDLAFARACLAEELRNVARHDAYGTATSRADIVATLATHRRLGAAYGYPSCCVDAFCDAHVETMLRRYRHHRLDTAGEAATAGVADGDNGLAIARAAGRTVSFDPLLAAIPGQLGDAAETTLRHLPCRFDCAASRRIAQTLLVDLAGVDPRRHVRLRHGVRRPVWIDAAGRAELARTAELADGRWRVGLSGHRRVHAAQHPLPGRPELPVLLPFHAATSQRSA